MEIAKISLFFYWVQKKPNNWQAMFLISEYIFYHIGYKKDYNLSLNVEKDVCKINLYSYSNCRVTDINFKFTKNIKIK